MIFLSCEIWIKLVWFFVFFKIVYGVVIYFWCEIFILNKGMFLEVESKNLKSNNFVFICLKVFWKILIVIVVKYYIFIWDCYMLFVFMIIC